MGWDRKLSVMDSDIGRRVAKLASKDRNFIAFKFSKTLKRLTMCLERSFLSYVKTLDSYH